MRVAFLFLYLYFLYHSLYFPKGWEFLGKTDGNSISITLSALYDKKKH